MQANLTASTQPTHSGAPAVTKSRKRKRESSLRVLSRDHQDLTPDEMSVRRYLSKQARSEFCTLTGTSKEEYRLKRLSSESDMDESDDDVAPLSANTNISPAMTFRWNDDVDSLHNDRIIRHVASLIYNVQSNPTARTLPRTATIVKFVEEDIVVFVKTYVRSCRKARAAKRHPVRKDRRISSMTKNRRKGRQRTRKEQLLEGVDKYIEDHGVDPTSAIRTPWMSEELSDCSLDDRTAYLDNLKKRNTLTATSEQDIADGVKILERVSLAWKSSKVSYDF
ncbi:hypothetical protein BC629DRAFT_1542689 [Irpex lacteus]|nr:hypothetical protein BC629DRAFT_1542689 [Irpex lacteus]